MNTLPGVSQDFPAQTIPKEVWGKELVRREVPTATISCWGAEKAKTLIGTEVEYFTEFFRWRRVVRKNPMVEVGTIYRQRVTTGILAKVQTDEVTQVVIQQAAAGGTGATVGMAGDCVLITTGTLLQ